MRKFNSKSKKIGTLRIDGTLWEKLKERAISRKWGFPLICSCNPKKKVWPDFKYGFHREDEREYLDFKDFPFFAVLHNSVESFIGKHRKIYM